MNSLSPDRIAGSDRDASPTVDVDPESEARSGAADPEAVVRMPREPGVFPPPHQRPAGRTTVPDPAAHPRAPKIWLLIVATTYTAVMLAVVAPHAALLSDEALYASQVSPRTPALTFTAPRASGVTYLIAPVVHLTGSTVALRAYLAVVAGILLVVAYWPWLRALRRPGIVPLAALLFAGLWTALFYGASDMPNQWLALAAVAATGWFVRYGQVPAPGPLGGIAVSVACMAMLRPPGAFWILLVLAAAMVLVRRWRTPGLYGAVAIGVAGGLARWIYDAYAHFGGLIARLDAGSREQGTIGWHPNGVLYHLYALTGPFLCRPCHISAERYHHAVPLLMAAWWLTIPLLVGAGLVAARRDGHLGPMAVAAACGMVIALADVLMIGYAAPRFLLPAYALLALPVAGLLSWLPRTVPRRLRLPAAATIVVLLLVHETTQLTVLRRNAYQPPRVDHAAAVLTGLGLRAPCMLAGVHRTQLAYQLGCRTTTTAHLHLYLHQDMVFLTSRSRADSFPHWRRHCLSRPGEGPWYAFAPADQFRAAPVDPRAPAAGGPPPDGGC